MRSPCALCVFTLLSLCAAAPLPELARRQGAGVGAGCDAIFSDTDTSSGQVVKQAGAWVAKQGLRRRQGAGVGAGCDAILSDADTSSGQIVKQGGAWAAKQIDGAPQRRQLDKMGAGVGYVVGALPGGQQAGNDITDETGTVDGDGTNGSADAGEGVGEFELNAGNAVTETAFGTTDGDNGGTSSGGGAAPAPAPAPGKKGPHKRQLDKMGAGVGYVVAAIPGGSGQQAGNEITNETGTVDGDGTNGSADAGEAVGKFELDEGNAVTETAFGTTNNQGGTS